MLKLRKEQIAAVQESIEGRFEKWLLDHVRSGFPTQTKQLNEIALQEKVRQGIARIEGYGIQDEESIVGYVDLSFKIGAEFEDKPNMAWSRQILNDPAIPSNEKVPLIDMLCSMDN